MDKDKDGVRVRPQVKIFLCLSNSRRIFTQPVESFEQIDGKWLIIDHHSSAMPETEEKKLAEVGKAFDKWNAALQTGDAKQVAALYAPGGVLLPTVSNRVRTTPEEIEVRRSSRDAQKIRQS